MSTTEDIRFPPGPPLPQAVQGAIFIGAQRQGLRLLRKRYGDAFTMNVPGFGKCVVISSPELIKQTYTAKPDVLHTGERNPLSYVLGPGSMFSLDEDEHLRERRLLLPPFHGERMQSYEAIIEEEALREMDSWPEGEEFETLEPMMRITLNAILRAVFGAEGAEFDALRKLLPDMVDLGQRLALIPLLRKDAGRFSPWVRFKRMRAAFDVQVESLIDRALADPDLEERADVLALLLRAKYEDDGSAMTRSAIADQLLTLLVAGHETTAGQLGWAIERLRRHPGVLRRLVEEVDADSGNAYRQATILEVQRTRPVITGHGRRVAKPFDLGEWRIPPRTTILVAATVVHDDDRFFDDAGRFDPERFVGKKPDTYKWVPFGGGTRRCIGAAFANMEMDIVLRTLLRRFDLATTYEPAERWHSRGVAFVPARGGRAVVRRREDAPQRPAPACTDRAVAVAA